MKFTTSPNKDYRGDIEILHSAIQAKKNFTFSKFCDGEWMVICNNQLNNKEFWFDPSDSLDQKLRQDLIKSFTFKHDQYYIGVASPNVFGLQMHRDMIINSQQDKTHITWADIWVNSNYPYYVNNILPLFEKRNVVLVCNIAANIENLPFKPRYTFRITNNAWKHNYSLIEELKWFIDLEDISNHIFLFCCGPFGNILCHRLTEHNKYNTYLDIGSTLNPWLQSAGFERHYYMGNNVFSNLVGTWDNTI
jgi:hypothetical protein